MSAAKPARKAKAATAPATTPDTAAAACAFRIGDLPQTFDVWAGRNQFLAGTKRTRAGAVDAIIEAAADIWAALEASRAEIGRHAEENRLLRAERLDLNRKFLDAGRERNGAVEFRRAAERERANREGAIEELRALVDNLLARLGEAQIDAAHLRRDRERAARAAFVDGLNASGPANASAPDGDAREAAPSARPGGPMVAFALTSAQAAALARLLAECLPGDRLAGRGLGPERPDLAGIARKLGYGRAAAGLGE